MEIEEVRVQNYRCIQDSRWVDFDQVVALVGPNEAGKTAFLQALKKLNPIKGDGGYDVTKEYPRRKLSEYRERHEENPDTVVRAKLRLNENEVDIVESKYGSDSLESDIIEVSKDYQNELDWSVDINEDAVIQSLLDNYDLPTSTENSMREADTIDELFEKTRESDAESGEFPGFEAQVGEIHQNGAGELVSNLLDDYLPEFLYFDEYYTMKGKVCIEDLVSKSRNRMSKDEETFLSFLSLAKFDIDDIQEMDDFEELIAELEAVSNRLTEKVFEYWTQGPNLRVQIREETEVVTTEGDNTEEKTYLHIRIFNERHRNTLPFGERSRGFIWFFSFLAYFSDIGGDNEDMVLLLDEPGLNLHAKAQHDLLRFINDELAPTHPVAYTTHSPFMLEPKRLDRARLVEDKTTEDDEVLGTKITEDILGSSGEALFPLQASLGYDLIQTLLIGPECLLVEGKSDMMYIQVISDILEKRDRESLSHRWTIVPVGGADNIPTFASLFGSSGLTIASLLDNDADVDQRIEEITSRSVIEENDIKTIDKYLGEDEECDIEDLFSQEFYVRLVEGTYLRELRFHDDVEDIDLESLDYDHPRVVNRIEKYFSRWDIGKFEHTEPAKHLQKNRDLYEEELPEEDLDGFEDMFTDINEILE